MGVSDHAIDVSKLDIGFGGFTPTSFENDEEAKEKLLQAQDRARQLRISREQIEELEAARASEEHTWTDDQGNVWSYVTLDDSDVRITKCDPQSTVLNVPSEIEGKPVVALDDDACSYLSDIEEIICPDSIILMGGCVFRECSKLQRATLSKNLNTYSSDWFRGCHKLEYLKLPGQMQELNARLFDSPALKHVVVGMGTEEVAPGTFIKSKLDFLEVDPDNPFLMTDGEGIYSRDGSTLMALALPKKEYRVQPGCRVVLRKGFSNFRDLEQVEMPDTLEVLEPFAFASTGLTSFTAPPSLKRIEEKAFFNCSKLTDIDLNEGLLFIGDNAFTGTALKSLYLPASVDHIGVTPTARTALTYSGKDATFSIDAASPHFRLDIAGGLYYADDEGKLLVRMMDEQCNSYTVEEDTFAIEEEAFLNHTHIAEVDIASGLTEIRKGAFRGCQKLVQVSIPDSVRRIDDEAFLDTNIAAIYLPAGLNYLGENALATYGAHHGESEPALHEVKVDEQNEQFYTEPGLLLQKKDDGNVRVLLCTGDLDAVHIPPEVNEIASYAFNGIQKLSELYLSERITNVGVRGLAVDCLIDHIHVDFLEPVEGHEGFDFYFPDTDRSIQQLRLALSVPSFVNVPALFEHYDTSIVNASSFDVRNQRSMDTYDQAARILDRLLDPVLLTSVNRSMADRVLKNHLEDICISFAEHDDRESIDKLCDLGYLNADNIISVIDSVGVVQDAAMTNYLLEIKRERFKQDTIDFEL